jgi:F-type H+-transporting ATPase subunit b
MKYRQSILALTSPLIITLVLTAAEVDVRTNVSHAGPVSKPVAVSLADNSAVIVDSKLPDSNEVIEHNKGHHPEVKLFGKPIGVLAQFGVTVFNFLIFFGILFLALKGALSSAFKTQKEELQNRLFKSEKDKEEAKLQIQELETRMAGLQQELSSVMAKAEMDAKLEQSQILEDAKTEVAHIVSQTHAEIESLKRGVKAELHAMVMELVVAKAEQNLTAQLHGDLAASTLDRAIGKVRGNK